MLPGLLRIMSVTADNDGEDPYDGYELDDI